MKRDLSQWVPCRLPDQKPMEGEMTRIVALDPEAHCDDLWEAFGGARTPDMWEFMPVGPFEDKEAFRQGLRWIAMHSDWVPFAILGRNTGRAFGTASYMRIDRANGVAEVGCIAYGDGLRRQPAGTEAMLLMGRRIFEDLGYRRYEWKCDARNLPSRRAAERLGFTFEGIFRQHMVVKGRNRDTAWFAVLDRDWARVSASMKRWLDPFNFDDEGQQKSGLRQFSKAS